MPKRTVHYACLEMRDPGELCPARVDRPDFRIEQARIPSPELNRFLYDAVGREWFWVDRLVWSRDEWLRYLDRPELETWIATLDGTPCGYVELELQPRRDVEIAYFGLLPGFYGQGLGGHLLTFAIERAWAMGAARVWVSTCSLDHPAALENYRARGLRVYKESVGDKDLPDEVPGPWSLT